MKTEVKYKRPDDAEVTITFTCTIEQLRKMKEQIENPGGADYAFWPLSTLMDQMRESIRWGCQNAVFDDQEGS